VKPEPVIVTVVLVVAELVGVMCDTRKGDVGELVIAASSRSATSGGDGYIHGPTTASRRTNHSDLGIAINCEVAGCRRAERNTSSVAEMSAAKRNAGSARRWPTRGSNP